MGTNALHCAALLLSFGAFFLLLQNRRYEVLQAVLYATCRVTHLDQAPQLRRSQLNIPPWEPLADKHEQVAQVISGHSLIGTMEPIDPENAYVHPWCLQKWRHSVAVHQNSMEDLPMSQTRCSPRCVRATVADLCACLRIFMISACMHATSPC